ncbi:hypothetical protein THIOSC13_810005 [uncultured Thiomicrorhabdus sp.]
MFYSDGLIRLFWDIDELCDPYACEYIPMFDGDAVLFETDMTIRPNDRLADSIIENGFKPVVQENLNYYGGTDEAVN